MNNAQREFLERVANSDHLIALGKVGSGSVAAALSDLAAKDHRIAELEAKSDDFDAEMTIVATALTQAFEEGRLDPSDKRNAQLSDIAESKKWMTEQVDDMRERIAELESQIAGHPEALAAAKREVLECAAQKFEQWGAGEFNWTGDAAARVLRRMAREVKP